MVLGVCNWSSSGGNDRRGEVGDGAMVVLSQPKGLSLIVFDVHRHDLLLPRAQIDDG